MFWIAKYFRPITILQIPHTKRTNKHTPKWNIFDFYFFFFFFNNDWKVHKKYTSKKKVQGFPHTVRKKKFFFGRNFCFERKKISNKRKKSLSLFFWLLNGFTFFFPVRKKFFPLVTTPIFSSLESESFFCRPISFLILHFCFYLSHCSSIFLTKQKRVTWLQSAGNFRKFFGRFWRPKGLQTTFKWISLKKDSFSVENDKKTNFFKKKVLWKIQKS